MDNPRPEKVAVVTEVRERFERSSAAILTEYRGLSVKDIAALRRLLRDAGGEYKVYKNTLVRFAAHDLGLEELDSLLTGPTAIAFVDGDASSVAKALREYARTNPKLAVKGGVLGKKVMSVADATALADLPPREVVLARLAGALAAPMQQFAGLLQAVPRSFAYGLKALIEKRGGVESADSGGATSTSSPVEVETSTSADAPAAAAASAEVAAPASSDVADSVAEAVSEAPLAESSAGEAEPATALVADAEPADEVGATRTLSSVDLETSTSADAPVAPSTTSEAPAASDVADSVSDAMTEPLLPGTSADEAEPAAALVADTEPADVAETATEPAESAVSATATAPEPDAATTTTEPAESAVSTTATAPEGEPVAEAEAPATEAPEEGATGAPAEADVSPSAGDDVPAAAETATTDTIAEATTPDAPTPPAS